LCESNGYCEICVFLAAYFYVLAGTDRWRNVGENQALMMSIPVRGAAESLIECVVNLRILVLIRLPSASRTGCQVSCQFKSSPLVCRLQSDPNLSYVNQSPQLL
jgi:hypothetical protein